MIDKSPFLSPPILDEHNFKWEFDEHFKKQKHNRQEHHK